MINKKYKLIYEIFLIAIFLSILFVLASSKSLAYTCLDGYYCTHNTQHYRGWMDYCDGKDFVCCDLAVDFYYCFGTDDNCSGGRFMYPTLEDCKAHTRGVFKGCCIGESCTPGCTPPVCPDGTISDDYGLGKITTQCTDDCGDKKYRNCYCPPADCADLDDQIIWYNTQQSQDDRVYTGLVPVVPTPPIGCSDTQNKTCYSNNKKPTVSSVQIVPADNITPTQASSNVLMKFVSKLNAAEFSDNTVLGYYSDTHSGRGYDYEGGGGVNNPVGLVATYVDPDGRDDIEALYIWWNPSSTKNFNTPSQITSNDKETESASNWGFIVAKNSSGNWSDVYVPGSSNTWVYAGSAGTDVDIFGPTSKEMITLSDISVSDSGTNGVQLQLKMNFLVGSSYDIVATSKYNIWAMANDYIGFTNMLEDGNIMDTNDWHNDSGWQDWTLDMVQPEIVFSSPADTAKSEVTIDYTLSDDDNLSNIRLDACKEGIESASNLTSNLLTGDYELKTCDQFSASAINMTTPNSLLGSDGLSNNVVQIDLGENKEGSITYYLTAMDSAGNIKLELKIYKLEQWATVKDGLVFGKEGVTSSTRELKFDSWDSHPFLKDFDETKIDLTNQVLLGAKSLSNIFLRELVRYKENKSFSAANYPGLYLGIPYQELRLAYQKKFSDSQINSVSGTLSGNLSENSNVNCSSEYCILESNSDLNIDNLVCDKKALIAVTGDINITPNLINDNGEDACIILAQDNINIVPVGSDEVNIVYDTIEAFLIAGGQINIPSDGNESDHGLYVEGGLISFTPGSSGSSIFNEREIFYSHMGIYPVLVVDNNSKYGLLGKDVFGSQIDVFKTEVGLKPY